jgi:hypothetical protein
MNDISWADISACQKCGCKDLVKLQNKHHTHDASVWDGAIWRKVKHGSTLCRKCHTIHKLNYMSMKDEKLSFITEPKDEQVYLLNQHLGFTMGFAKQLWNRACRMHCSLRGEACSILLTRTPEDIPKSNLNDKYLAQRMKLLLFGYLCVCEKRVQFDIDDPIPEGDPEYDGNLINTFQIFNATLHDPHFQTNEIDVVTDGNYQLNRVLEASEKKGLKRMQGRPKPEAAKANQKANAGVSSSRCQTVSAHEKIKLARKRTGGIFCTVDMKRSKGKRGGNQIVQLSEMLNSECTEYKLTSLKQVIDGAGPRKRVKVNKYCHDCACVTAKHMEERFKVKCYLDGFHAKKHKCGFRRIQYQKKLNSSAAEQLWARMNRFSKGLTQFRRRYYRMWIRHYAVWRNAFIRGNSTSDTHPCVSIRALER